MPASGGVEVYRVKPGSRVDFASLDPADRSLAGLSSKEEMDFQFATLHEEFVELQKRLFAENKHRVLVVVQAMDTGGKDGCIKSVFSGVDPQGVWVRSFKSPTPEELAYDFLWRVHSKVPQRGQLVIFNRSHYEDVIAVRVKKLFPDEVWQRRERHIVEFERMLAEEGTTIVKIFLHISKAEQRRRLESRLQNPNKHWKFNPEDLKDRSLWDPFMTAYEEVISKTSTESAPWYVVPSDRKWYRNLCVVQLMVETLRRLEMKYPKISWDPKDMRLED